MEIEEDSAGKNNRNRTGRTAPAAEFAKQLVSAKKKRTEQD